MYTVTLEWDARKAASNVRKHDIDFADAVSVLVLRPDDLLESAHLKVHAD